MPVTENMLTFEVRAICIGLPDYFPTEKNKAVSFMKENIIPIFKSKFTVTLFQPPSSTSYNYIKIHNRKGSTRRTPNCNVELGSHKESISWKKGVITFWNVPDEWRREYNFDLFTRSDKKNTLYYDYSGKNIADTLVMIRKMLE